MIQIFDSEHQDRIFYYYMGEYFADLGIAKELERQLYNRDNSVWYVSFDSSTAHVQGFAAMFYYKHWIMLDNVYVLPEYRGKGICSEIMDMVFALPYDMPVDAIIIKPEMEHLLKKHGFTHKGYKGKWKKYEKDKN